MTAHLLSVDRFATCCDRGIWTQVFRTAGSNGLFPAVCVFVGTSCANPTSPDDAPRILRYDVKRWNLVNGL